MSEKFPLRANTPKEWAQHIVENFDQFLIDHAAAEKKASGMAVSMISHYPDRKLLVEKMADLAIEEMNHYREVIKIIHQRGIQLGPDTKDQYVIQFRKHIRQGKEAYFLDRLLTGAIIEARGAERFGLVADALEDAALKRFYKAITQSEKRHFDLLHGLALEYFAEDEVTERLNELLDAEAKIIIDMPITAALH